MLNKQSAIVLFFLLINFVHAGAQNSENKDYYYFPIRPGQTNYLSGTMGELRASHFHAGIDIKTGGVEGLPVYAAADGYVSRIKISTGGYGNALYIQHPNSTTTVYAHLLKYNDEIGAYIRKAQYRDRTFEIELFPEKGELPVKRGEVIGLSGNSGSSGGPHLHFEIRDANQDVLNPLHYSFEEVKDNIPPTVVRLALVPLDINSRVNGQFSRFEFSPYRRGSNYYLNEPVSVYGNIGVQILAYDRLNDASNRNGVVCMDMSVNGDEKFYQNISKFSFSETRNILAHYDYEVRQETGQRFQKLYVDDGNLMSIYKTDDSGGAIAIRDQEEHQVTINLYDAYNNRSQVQFKLKGTLPSATAAGTGGALSSPTYRTSGEILTLEVPIKLVEDDQHVQVYANRLAHEYFPAYSLDDRRVYLWHLSNGIPDSIIAGGATIYPEYDILVPSEAEFSFYHNLMDIYFPKNALFDTLALSVDWDLNNKSQEIFSIGNENAPLRKSIYITLKPSTGYDLRDKSAVYQVNSRGGFSHQGGEWRGSNIRFSTRSFGKFTILADTVAPEIVAAKINSETLSFYISDDLSGIKSFEATVNGEWVLMNYDYKKRLIWSEKIDPSKPFTGKVVLKVTDEAGNEKTYTSNL